MQITFLFLLSSLSSIMVSSAQGTFSPIKPPSIPLAVKSPYLSTWLPAGNVQNSGNLAGRWATHWSGNTLGWTGLISVDGNSYVWMGDPTINKTIPLVEQVSFNYTSTQSTFTMKVSNKVEMIITFLSPVNPVDLKRLSIVGSYMDVQIRSIDNKAHNVGLYTDISGEWATGDLDVGIQWETKVESECGMQIHKIKRQQEIEFDESDKPWGNGMANWGTIWYAADFDSNVTYMFSSDVESRSYFVDHQKLPSQELGKFRNVNDDWPVFAFAKSFCNVAATPQNWKLSIGLLQDNAVQFLSGPGIKSIPSLWKSYWPEHSSIIEFFHCDYELALAQCQALDQKVLDDSFATGETGLAIIAPLVVRQAFGANQLAGTPDKPLYFQKEISSNGNTNTVDVIFPAHPIFLYFNSVLLKYLLEPLFAQQENGNWPHTYAEHDIGTHFPNATGYPDGNAEEMPLEECGNMIIMCAAYLNRSGDVQFIKDHYPLLQKWVGYLELNALEPNDQLSTDDFAGTLANQTNLALKGIIGIRAMALLAKVAGSSADETHYLTTAQSFIEQWQDKAIAYNQTPPRTTLSYGDEKSHGLLYNIWADVELGTNLVPHSVYDMQSAFYMTVREEYGIPLDTRHDWVKADWIFFVAASTQTATSKAMVADVVTFLRNTNSSSPFTDLYHSATAEITFHNFRARPVMGAAFAPLIARYQG